MNKKWKYYSWIYILLYLLSKFLLLKQSKNIFKISPGLPPCSYKHAILMNWFVSDRCSLWNLSRILWIQQLFGLTNFYLLSLFCFPSFSSSSSFFLLGNLLPHKWRSGPCWSCPSGHTWLLEGWPKINWVNTRHHHRNFAIIMERRVCIWRLELLWINFFKKSY